MNDIFGMNSLCYSSLFPVVHLRYRQGCSKNAGQSLKVQIFHYVPHYEGQISRSPDSFYEARN